MAAVIKVIPQDPVPTPLKTKQDKQIPYPVNALGSVLAPAVKALANGVQVPESLAAQSVLSAAAFAAQPHADVVIDGRRNPLCLFMLSVAESGDRKSAVDKFATKPAKDRQDQLREDYREQKQWYDNELQVYEEMRKQVLASNKKNGGNQEELTAALKMLGLPPKTAKIPQILSSEPTPEGLVKAFAKGWQSQGLFSSEGGAFFGGGAMADSKLKTIALLSSFWDGEQINRTRASEGESLTVNNPRLSAHLMIQPVVATSVLNDPVLAGQGFTARFLVASPDSLAGTRLYNQVDLSQNKDIKLFQERLAALFAMDQPVDEQGNLAPRELRLSDEAHHEWVESYNEIELELGVDGNLRDIRATGSKAAEHATRIAGVLALVENPAASVISGDIMKRAFDLAVWYLSELLRLTNRAEETIEQHQGRKLITKMIKSGWDMIMPTKIVQNIKGIGSVHDAKKVIELLEEHGWLIRQPKNTVVDGKQRQDVWRLNHNATIKGL